MTFADAEISKIMTQIRPKPSEAELYARPTSRRRGPMIQRAKPGQPVPPNPAADEYKLALEGLLADPNLVASPFNTRVFPFRQPHDIIPIYQNNAELIDTHIEPANNWAKVYGSCRRKGGFSLGLAFRYFWRNEAPNAIHVSAETLFVASGMTAAGSSSDFWVRYFDSEANMTVQLKVRRAAGWGNYNDQLVGFLAGSRQSAQVCHSKAFNGVFSGEYDSDTVDFDKSFDLDFKSLQVPAGASVIFEVTMTMYGFCDSGSSNSKAVVAFDSKGVYCPYLIVTARTGI